MYVILNYLHFYLRYFSRTLSEDITIRVHFRLFIAVRSPSWAIKKEHLFLLLIAIPHTQITATKHSSIMIMNTYG
jgi:hypothetical protein